VTFAGDYEWSNYRATAGLQTSPPWLEIDWTLDQFGPDRASAHEAYRQYVAGGRGASYDPRAHLVGQMYLESAAFCDRMQALVSSKDRSREHPRRQRIFVRPELEAIVTGIAQSFGIKPEDLRRKSRGRARKTLAFLAVDDAGLTMRAVAEWLGATAGAASKMRAAAKELWAKDQGYRVLVERIRSTLS